MTFLQLQLCSYSVEILIQPRLLQHFGKPFFRRPHQLRVRQPQFSQLRAERFHFRSQRVIRRYKPFLEKEQLPIRTVIKNLHPACPQVHFDPVSQFRQRLAFEIVVTQERHLARCLVQLDVVGLALLELTGVMPKRLHLSLFALCDGQQEMPE